ncbi:DUF4260 domain-containing protein [Undibacterium sp. TC4M20W]|uniref:DUF4260 domain-containing protein n=1 Tax=Undibacterium sp. TC4M20W TaxID=3413052 RepID=UPI003BF015BE
MTGTVSGGVRTVLRLEGVCVLLSSLIAYSEFGAGWGVFALFFLAPDLSLLAYLAGPRAGALIYNTAHSYAGATLILASGIFFSAPLAITAGLIWISHIGFDRALGYGLKYSIGFRFTHLGVIGRDPDNSQIKTK